MHIYPRVSSLSIDSNMAEKKETPADLRPLVLQEIEEAPEADKSISDMAETEAADVRHLLQVQELEEAQEADQSTTDPQLLPSKQPPSRPVPLKGPFRHAVWTWILAIITFFSITATIIFAWQSAHPTVYSTSDPVQRSTETLRILRILAEVNTALLSTLVAMSARITVWAASSGKKGVSVPMWLAMSPTTGILGLLELLLWGRRPNDQSRKGHRAWIIIRLSIQLSIPAISLLLTAVFATTTKYWILSQQQGTAGVGKFNVELANDVSFTPLGVLEPFTRDVNQSFGAYPNNAGWPVSTQQNDSMSTIFFGSLWNPYPSQSNYPVGMPGVDTVIIRGVSALQIEIWPLAPHPIDQNDCRTWVANDTWAEDDSLQDTLVGLQICIAKPKSNDTYLIGSVSSCNTTAACESGSWMDSGRWFGFRSSLCTADVHYNASTSSGNDGTITAVQNLSPPILQTLLPSDLLSSYTAFFDNDSSVQEPTGFGFKPFSSDAHLENSDAISWTGTFCALGTLPMHCGFLFALPLLAFQPKSPFLDVANLSTPNQTIEFAQSCAVPIIPSWAVVVYLIVSSFILAWSVGGLALALLVDSPAISNFDLLDFAARINANRSDASFAEPLASLSIGHGPVHREVLEYKDIFVRDVGGQMLVDGEDEAGPHVGKIGFTMDGGKGRMLVKGSLYS